MLAAFLKIVPVLWPFFKEMIMGGSKDPLEGPRTARLKGLFYAIMLLLGLLGYAGYYMFQMTQQFHLVQTENVKLTLAVDNGTTTAANTRTDLDRVRDDNQQLSKRLREVREQQLTLATQNGDLREQLATEKAKSEHLQWIIDQAGIAGKNLTKFNVRDDSPRTLRKHNESVDVLKQLQQEAQDVEGK